MDCTPHNNVLQSCQQVRGLRVIPPQHYLRQFAPPCGSHFAVNLLIHCSGLAINHTDHAPRLFGILFPQPSACSSLRSVCANPPATEECFKPFKGQCASPLQHTDGLHLLAAQLLQHREHSLHLPHRLLPHKAVDRPVQHQALLS
jgi:hypothetical protein